VVNLLSILFLRFTLVGGLASIFRVPSTFNPLLEILGRRCEHDRWADYRILSILFLRFRCTTGKGVWLALSVAFNPLLEIQFTIGAFRIGGDIESLSILFLRFVARYVTTRLTLILSYFQSSS